MKPNTIISATIRISRYTTVGSHPPPPAGAPCGEVKNPLTPPLVPAMSDVRQLRVDGTDRVHLIGDQLRRPRGTDPGGRLERLLRAVRRVQPSLPVQGPRLQEPREHVHADLTAAPPRGGPRPGGPRLEVLARLPGHPPVHPASVRLPRARPCALRHP